MIVLPTPDPVGYTPGNHGRDAYVMLYRAMVAYPVMPTPDIHHVGSLSLPIPWGKTLTPPVLPQ